jgi:cytoskeleton protein RodZ
MSDGQESEVQAAQPAGPGPGAKLALAREQQGKTREQVAAVLNIQMSKIVALETDQYEQVFSPVFTRGYLRSYAKLLGLDAEALVREYESDFRVHEPATTASEPLNVAMSGHAINWPLRIALALLLLVLLAIVLWYFNRPAAEPDLPSTAAHTASGQSSLAGKAAVAPEPQPATGELTAASALTAKSASAPAAHSPDQLTLSFSQECWLEVLDANGDLLAADLQRQGTRINLQGQAPFDVKLGSAQGVSILLNGRATKIPSPQGDSKVVRFDVGKES